MLDESRARALKCCRYCLQKSTIAKRAIASGWQVFAYCGTCDRHAWGSKSFLQHDGDVSEIPDVWRPMSICDHCKVEGPTEVHHFAPRAIFGRECDDWATADLCRECHLEWHRRTGI